MPRQSPSQLAKLLRPTARDKPRPPSNFLTLFNCEADGTLPRMAEAPKSDAPLSDDARRELEELYREVDRRIASTGVECWVRGVCCDFDRTDHRLYASSIEVAYVREKHWQEWPSDSRLCPFWVEGRCTERERRPLGCRTYFCDASFRDETHSIYEVAHRAIQELAARHGLDYRYTPFVDALRTRPPSDDR